jgi:hypothetical protein
MMMLTFAVWLTMYVRRLGYIARHRIPAQDLATPEKRNAAIPESVNLPAYNLQNLFEMPVVFYVICLLLMALQQSDPAYVNLAWAFVALRAAHSVVHCTFNRVILRFVAYVSSCIVLAIMLGRLALQHF